MSRSAASSEINRTGSLLRTSASNQILEYDKRFDSIKDLYSSFLCSILVSDFSHEKAYEMAKRFFGTDTVEFAAIDGTEYVHPLFDMITFFGGAYAAKGTIRFKPDKPPEVEYATRFAEQGRGLSSCIPIFTNKVLDIDKSLNPKLEVEPTQISLVTPLTNEAIANNSAIATWIMAFSEIYLAYKLASNSERKPRILFLDRSLTCPSLLLFFYMRTRRRKA